MIVLSLIGGLVLLVAGGELLVRGSVTVALRFDVPPLVIGLTLVGFGTSMPELITSLDAAFIGAPGIAVGNVVGSNTANILLILGLAAVIMPITVAAEVLRADGAVMLAAAVACAAAVLAGHVGRAVGVLLVLLLIAYVWHTFHRQRRPAGTAAGSADPAPDLLAGPTPRRLGAGLLLILLGLTLTIVGADQLVKGAIGLARVWAVSETVIGVTIVAVGTSLPELVTSVTAAVRHQPDIAFGNIVGSNIFNVLGILGVTAIVHPLPVPPEIARLDVWCMLAATVVLLAAAATGGRLSRPEGTVFLLAYVAYLGALTLA